VGKNAVLGNTAAENFMKKNLPRRRKMRIRRLQLWSGFGGQPRTMSGAVWNPAVGNRP